MQFGNPCVIEIRPRAVIRVTGDDAATFLQGQFSNELRKPVGSATYGLWLDQKGKVLADSFVLGVGEKNFLIVSDHVDAAVIMQRLEHYLVADDVVLADETGTTHGLLVAGDQGGALVSGQLGSVPLNGQYLRVGEWLAYRGRRSPRENFQILSSPAAIAGLRASLLAAGGSAASEGDLDFDRISAGLPAVPLEVGPGDLPNEAGLDEVAISYTKGCYLGQEVMARLKNLGQVRRQLRVIRGTGVAPAPKAALYQGDKKVGEVRSVAVRGSEYVGFAMISLINFQPGIGASLGPMEQPVITVAHG